jgi:hypothetical protein
MRVKVLRNIGIQTVREFSEKGLTVDQLQEGQVVNAAKGVGEALIARGLAAETDEPVTKIQVAGHADQPHDSPISELSRPAAGTGHERTKADPNDPEPGRQAGSSATGTGDTKRK